MVMLKFHFPLKMKILFVLFYWLEAIKLMTLKTSAYLMKQLNTFYRQQGLTFLFEKRKCMTFPKPMANSLSSKGRYFLMFSMGCFTIS